VQKIMNYSVRHKDDEREDFGPYRYDVLHGKQIVATYSHDYRGDDHWIEFADGSTQEWPVGRRTDFLKGGGPQRLRLSDAAIVFLKKQLEE
jgi:hypothetical protein